MPAVALSRQCRSSADRRGAQHARHKAASTTRVADSVSSTSPPPKRWRKLLITTGTQRRADVGVVAAVAWGAIAASRRLLVVRHVLSSSRSPATRRRSSGVIVHCGYRRQSRLLPSKGACFRPRITPVSCSLTGCGRGVMPVRPGGCCAPIQAGLQYRRTWESILLFGQTVSASTWLPAKPVSPVRCRWAKMFVRQRSPAIGDITLGERLICVSCRGDRRGGRTWHRPAAVGAPSLAGFLRRSQGARARRAQGEAELESLVT